MTTIDLCSENFETVTSAEGVVLVDAWAPWCAPCRGYAPVFERASVNHPDCVFAKLNTEQNKDLRDRLGIQHIPSLIVYRDGVMLYNAPGSPPPGDLAELIAQARDLDMDEVRARKAAESESAPQGEANRPS